MIRRTITWLAVGVSLGLVGSMWYGPRLIGWWWQPPGQVAAFSCAPQIAAATESLVKMQLIAGGITGVFLALIANLIAKKRAPVPATPAAKI